MSLHTNVAIDQVHSVPSVESLHGPRWLQCHPFARSAEEIFTSGLEQQKLFILPYSHFFSFGLWRT